MIYDRKTKETVQEKVYEYRAMRFLYNTAPGGLCVLFLRLPVVSKIYGRLQKSKHSVAKIKKLIDTYEIETDGGEHNFSSFNDFIIRKRLRTDFDSDTNHLIAPADSCLLAYNINNDVIFSVKDKKYTLSRFLKDDALAREYEGGTVLIFRLRVYDNHRFCFVDNGTVLSHRFINGFLDSVNTKATGRFTLSSNCREISVLQTEHFEKTVVAEVGAMLVGRIVQTHGNRVFNKGDEKGYFEFGGSSIILLLKKDAVKIDDDIMECSAKGIETKVSFGEMIGERRA